MTDGEQGDGRGRPAPAPRYLAGRGVRAGRVGGAPLYLSPAALVFSVFVGSAASTADASRLPALSHTQVDLLAVVSALAFLASLVLHEVGHAVVAQALRLRVRSIVIYGFAGFTEIEPEPGTPGQEFAVAVAGPLVNLALAGGFAVMWALTGDATVPRVFAEDLTVTNLLLGLFNLVPGLPLDGGRALAAGLWRLTSDRLRATRWAASAGLVVAAALGALGLWLVLRADPMTYNGFLFLATAAFIGVGAQQSRRRAQVRERLPGLSAGVLARRAVAVDPGLPLAEALRRAAEAGALGVYTVEADGRPTAVMTGAAADAVPAAKRPWMAVSSVCRGLQAGLVLPADLEGEPLLRAVQVTPASEYLVVRPGALVTASAVVGVLATVDLVARLDPASAQRYRPAQVGGAPAR